MSVSSGGSSDRTPHLTRMLYKRPYEKLMRLGLGDLAVVGNRPLPEKVASVAEWETKYGSLLDAATNMLAESIAGTLVLQLLLHTTGEGLRSAQRDGVFFRFPLPVFSLTDRRTPLLSSQHRRRAAQARAGGHLARLSHRQGHLRRD